MNPCTGGNTTDCDDNCPDDSNPDQADSDNDGIGGVCDVAQFNLYDTNQDWVIDDFELLDAIDAWAVGSLGDFEFLDLIDYWAIVILFPSCSKKERLRVGLRLRNKQLGKFRRLSGDTPCSYKYLDFKGDIC